MSGVKSEGPDLAALKVHFALKVGALNYSRPIFYINTNHARVLTQALGGRAW